ncbi:ABC transporter permease [Salipiger abyssi]|uniref:ABC transporter permease n=1 Tax=Salipiger abyssi TaxID=1250539 RepID=UPI001A8C74C0|nr:ABC transporter permease subunit [Salipiger abyssi]MBN9886312.1 ABC transporter permease subunit [Salipiger abyssi]
MSQAETEFAAPAGQGSGLAALLRKPWLFWATLFLSTALISHYAFDLYKALDARWIIRFPSAWQPDFEGRISAFMTWLLEDARILGLQFREITRGLAAMIEAPYDLVLDLFVRGLVFGQGQQAVQILPPLSWVAVVYAVVALGHYTKSWALAALMGGCFGYLAVFGQWESAMVTLSSVLIAVPLAAGGGLLLGILAYRLRWVDLMLRPVLDLMQTVPVFAYLVPILFMFGFGPVSALVATIIYATPPMIRVTIVALRGVPEELAELGRMVGCTPRQQMWKVMVPSAKPTIMVGVNQVIMLTLNMVIIASMIGAGGLGYDVLTALRRLDIGGGIEAGIAIVVLAIALDRLSQEYATRTVEQTARQAQGGWLRRHRWALSAAAVALATFLAGMVLPWIQNYPAAAEISTGAFWTRAMEYINVTYFDTLDAIKTVILQWFMLPVRAFFTGIPWVWGLFAATLIGLRAGGWRLAALVFCLVGLIVLAGLWTPAMMTVYLCGVSVVIASVIGIPLGIWAAGSAGSNRVIGAFVDTLQTLPSFVYLIPVVMLFRVGDFSAMIAIVAYALAPAVRYAAHGIRSIDPQVIEAGIVSGCTPAQLMRRIKLPMIVPELLLGLNQTIMLALSMLVITALVGTRDLGQDVYIALTKADTGQGIVVGLAVAFIAITADRILAASARQMRRKLGIEQ